MATSVARGGRQSRFATWRDGVRRATCRSVLLLSGAALVVGALLLLVALGSYHPSDPSLNTAAARPVRNWLGAPRPWIADLLLTMLMRWSRNMPKPATEWPALKQLADLVRARPSWKKLYEIEGLAEW